MLISSLRADALRSPLENINSNEYKNLKTLDTASVKNAYIGYTLSKHLDRHIKEYTAVDFYEKMFRYFTGYVDKYIPFATVEQYNYLIAEYPSLSNRYYLEEGKVQVLYSE